ncbi:MAG: glycosyltransferase [Clostridia bacterium]|nr:glycosyltransferase [Clostridia bacterium]
MGVLKRKTEKFIYYIKKYGLLVTLKKCLSVIFKKKTNTEKINEVRYVEWMQKNNLTNEAIEAQRIYKFENNPKISIIVPMYNTNEKYFAEMIDYMRMQTYINWELCLADGSEVENKNLKKYYEIDTRIKYNFLKGNKGIAENTNQGIKMVTGDYVGFLDHDDLLTVDCLFELVKEINKNPEVDFIYTDEDKINDDKIRSNPYFKPDFSKETLECNNYITHFCLVKTELLKEVGGLNEEFNGAQDFDLVLRITEKAKNIVHIPKILYHWRINKNSTARVADTKPYAYEAGKRVVESYLERNNKKALVEYGNDVPGIYKIIYEVIRKSKSIYNYTKQR